MTQEELENGFSRQVYLYSGLGFEKMKEIIEKQFPNDRAASVDSSRSFCECVSEKDHDSKYCTSCNKFHSI